MSNRTVRINELIQRELNDILRRHYQTEAVAITVTEVRISTDLRDGKVFVAIIGDDELVVRRMVWLRRQARDIREELARRITLKFLPNLGYSIDETTPRSARVLRVLDDLVRQTPSLADTPAATPTSTETPPSAPVS